MVFMTIGERLKFHLDKMGISGKKLAEAVGLHPSQISKIINNDSNPSLDALERICVVLGITEAEFFAVPLNPRVVASTPVTISSQDIELLRKLKNLPATDQKEIEAYIRFKKNQNSNDETSASTGK